MHYRRWMRIYQESKTTMSSVAKASSCLPAFLRVLPTEAHLCDPRPSGILLQLLCIELSYFTALAAIPATYNPEFSFRGIFLHLVISIKSSLAKHHVRDQCW